MTTSVPKEGTSVPKEGTPYEAGRRAEYAAIAQLRIEGYQAVRTAGSHGPFDIVAWKDRDLLFVQVKRVSNVEAIAAAIRAAEDGLRAADFPVYGPWGVEIWIRHKAKFLIYSPRLKH